MKKYLLISVLLLIMLNLFSVQSDYIIAKAGKDIIMKSDLNKQILQMKNAQIWNETATARLVLEDMIEAKIIVVKARELGLKPDELKIKNIVEKQINSIKSQFPDEESFFAELRKANLTLSDLKKYYEDMLTDQQLKEQLISSQIKKKANVTEVDVKNYFEQNRDEILKDNKLYNISIILRNVKASQHTKDLAYQKIQDVKAKLKKGKKFEELAKQYSDCPSGQNGGDLGYFSKGQMVKSFEEAAFKLRIGEVSDIVQTEFGYHLIKLEEIKDKEIRARHILAKTDPVEADIASEHEFTLGLYNKLLKGDDFGVLAKEFSEDDSTKVNNGLMGTFTSSEFPELFAEKLVALPDSSISEVIQNENTFYIFKKQKVDNKNVSFDEYKDKIFQYLVNKKQTELYNNWIDSVKKEFFIKIYEDKLNEFNQELNK